MKFIVLANYLNRLEKEASRNKITEILSDLFKESSADEIDKIVYLVLGQIAPNYQGLVLNMAEKMMIRVIANASKVSEEKVMELYKKEGDLGNVSFKLIKGKSDGLTVNDVYKKLVEIANDSGLGSQERKVVKLSKLLSNLDPLSAKYVCRIPVGKLRLGFSDMTILDALSFMLKGDKSARKEIEAAFNVSVDTGKIAKVVKEKGLSRINEIEAQAGIPIRPALAERLPSAEKMLEKVGKKVIVEPKYDGFRTQVHIFKKDGQKKVLTFSRNLETTTHMFPDLVEAALKVDVESAIFDGEAIAYDEKNDRFLPFQETVQRKRKHGITQAVKDVPLKLFIFDILFKDGKSLLNLPFSERRKELEKINFSDRRIEIARQNIVDNASKIRDLIKKYLAEGLEGGMIKKIDAPYKPGARGYHWVKYKKTTEEGVADTIDCLVMGTYKGKGRRSGFGVGAFLVGIKDKEKFKTVSKIGTGLTDEQWKELNRRTRKIATGEKPNSYVLDKNLNPDTWVKPSLVVEILADEITKSPIHTAGLALRFPRLVRFRDDKKAKDSNNLQELKKLFEMQKV
ncbi:ATP-dependent DNA ligase [Patescibacteria group bacterium]|nr:ATP-dependent DNA ligase [Patescibacteria group bacterium]MBU2036112.1 ATP-dependent DNA ligase [Patescibacteria group bacterium]